MHNLSTIYFIEPELDKLHQTVYISLMLYSKSVTI